MEVPSLATLRATWLVVALAIGAACAPPAPAPKPTDVPKAAVPAATTAPAGTKPTEPKPAVAAAPTAAAPAKPAAAQGTPKPGGTLVVALEGEPPAIDPAGSNVLGAHRIARQITETLIKEDTKVLGVPNAPIVPGLAERFETSADGTAYTFFLRKGVKFHDGTDFDAEAVKVNFDRIMDKESKFFYQTAATVTGKTTTWIDSYSVVDPSTFKIQLKSPFGSFDRALMHPTMGIISPAALEKFGNEGIGANLIGTGAFMYKERERGVKVVLVKNPSYWDKENVPYLDQVVWRVMPDASSRAVALKTGEVDLNLQVLPDLVDDLKRDPNVEVVLANNPHLWFFALNHTLPMMQDVRVRRALWHAIDREGMAKALFNGTAQGAWTYLPQGNPAHRPNTPNPYPYDPAKAKALLQEAGVAGEPFNIVHPTTDGNSFIRPSAMVQYVQANLKDAGPNVTVEGLEGSAFSALGAKPPEASRNMSGTAWQSIAHDPYMLEQLWGCEFQVPRGSNGGMACFKDTDAILAQARQEPDAAKRYALYQKAEDMMFETVPAIPIANDFSPRAYRKNVMGLAMGPSTFFDLYGVWLEK